MSLDCCCIFIPSTPSVDTASLLQCDKTACLNTGKYKTSCDHHFCYFHLIEIESNEMKCLKDSCLQTIQNTVTVAQTDQTRTITQLKEYEKAKQKRICCLGCTALALVAALTTTVILAT